MQAEQERAAQVAMVMMKMLLENPLITLLG